VGAAARVARRVPLRRRALAGEVLDVAPSLLNKLVVRGERVGRIVEVEAYRGESDPASHAFGGPTRRNATMFGPAGGLYVYFTYGMHWCANVVCGPVGVAQAVLLRALAPVAGIEAMRRARSAVARDVDLANGPAKLCQAFSITGTDDGTDLVAGGPRADQAGRLYLAEDGVPPPPVPGQGPRVGISRAADWPWRFWVPEDPHVSGARRWRRSGR
jgi:DNA-3-methyladenine glycosylase